MDKTPEQIELELAEPCGWCRGTGYVLYLRQPEGIHVRVNDSTSHPIVGKDRCLQCRGSGLSRDIRPAHQWGELPAVLDSNHSNYVFIDPNDPKSLVLNAAISAEMAVELQEYLNGFIRKPLTQQTLDQIEYSIRDWFLKKIEQGLL